MLSIYRVRISCKLCSEFWIKWAAFVKCIYCAFPSLSLIKTITGIIFKDLNFVVMHSVQKEKTKRRREGVSWSIINMFCLGDCLPAALHKHSSNQRHRLIKRSQTELLQVLNAGLQMPDFIILISAAPGCIPIFQFPTVNISLHSANCRGHGMLLKLLVMNGLYKLKWYHGKEQKNYCEQKSFIILNKVK